MSLNLDQFVFCNSPSRFVALANSLKSRPNILTGAGWIFLFLGNLTLRKKLVNLKPFLMGEEFSSLGGLGNVRGDDFLGSVLSCTMWACFELGTAGNFRTGFRPTATRSIFTGCSYLMMDLGGNRGESLDVLLLWMPLSSVELSPLEDELDLKKKNRSKHHNWVNYGAVILFLQKCYFKSVNTVAILTDLKTYSCNLELAVTRLSNFSNCSLVQRKDFERSWTGSQGSCLMYLKKFQWIDFIIFF